VHGMDDETLREFARSLEQDYAGTLKRFLSLQARSGDDAREVIAALRAKLLERGEPSLETLRAGLKILHDLDLRHEVGRIAARTLVIHGDHDTVTPLAAGQWLAQQLPHGEMVTVPGGAHAPFLSHRGRTMEAMERFLHV
jgi:pimeloyl-[acyl-carrier protein] methyl ester esterase